MQVTRSMEERPRLPWPGRGSSRTDPQDSSESPGGNCLLTGGLCVRGSPTSI